MPSVLDAFWRACAYCFHPRVILWSVLPIVVAAGAVVGLGWMYWESTVANVRGTLDQWDLLVAVMRWLDSVGGATLHALLAPIIVVALSLPLVVVTSLLLVAVVMTPAVVSLVARRRFPTLERKRGAAWWQSLLWSLACTLAAVVALLLSMPLWLVPPLVLVLPPLIWGWLTYRVFAFEVLASHASADERRSIVHQHRWQLLAMGVVCGYLGAAPLLVWAVSAAAVVFAPVLVVVSVWLYTLVFAFAACWFAHYALSALQRLREQTMSNVNDLPEALVGPATAGAPGASTHLKILPLP